MSRIGDGDRVEEEMDIEMRSDLEMEEQDCNRDRTRSMKSISPKPLHLCRIETPGSHKPKVVNS